MNCTEVRKHWELYHDSEGDGELYLAINNHLDECPACSTWFSQQSAFEGLLCDKLGAGAATPEMWQRIVNNVGVAEPAAHGRWFNWSPLFAVAASLLVIASAWWASEPREQEHLSTVAAALHERLEMGGQPVAFESDSDFEVERYLKNRVTFPVRCPPRDDAGFSVRGGGVCTIARSPAAYVVGRVAEGDVSVLILPASRLDQFDHERDALAAAPLHHCREGRYDMVLTRVDQNLVVVIGSAKPADLERVARAYGTYPEGPGASVVPAAGRHVPVSA